MAEPQVILTGGVGEAPQEVRVGAGVSFVFSAKSPAQESENEDAAAVLDTGKGRGVLAVADGAGGHRAGAAASRLALEYLGECVVQADEDTARTSILDGIERADLAVRELGVGAATTLVAVEIDGASMRPYHVGDSEIWVVGQRGRIKLQTISHSPVGYAVEAGLLSEDEALAHEDRHLVSNLLGADGMRIEMGSPLELAPRDTLLLGSDGLFDNLSAEAIVDLVCSGPLDRAAETLAESGRAAMEDGKLDDMTFILFRLDGARKA